MGITNPFGYGGFLWYVYPKLLYVYSGKSRSFDLAQGNDGYSGVRECGDFLRQYAAKLQSETNQRLQIQCI